MTPQDAANWIANFLTVCAFRADEDTLHIVSKDLAILIDKHGVIPAGPCTSLGIVTFVSLASFRYRKPTQE